LKEIMLKRICKKEMRVKLYLKGFGVSIVDSEPWEVLYMSVYKIELEYKNSTEADSNGTIAETGVDLKVFHF